MKLSLGRYIIFECFLILVPIMIGMAYIMYRVSKIYIPSNEEIDKYEKFAER